MLIVGSVPIAAQDHDFSPAVSVGTNKATYKPGETVVITGRYYCSICGKGIAGTVSIRVSTPTGVAGPWKFDTDGGGSYSKSIRLSEKATLGVYTVSVVVSKSGFSDAANKKRFNVESGNLAISVQTDRGTYRARQFHVMLA